MALPVVRVVTASRKVVLAVVPRGKLVLPVVRVVTAQAKLFLQVVREVSVRRKILLKVY